MTIRFASPQPAAGLVTPSSARLIVGGFPANDNEPSDYNPIAQNRLLGDALRHFARHGLRAAEQARDEARAAHALGDGRGYTYWLAICRMLDRRMANSLATRIALPAR